jgi:hypothetical protein
MTDEEELSPQMNMICEEFIELSNNNPTVQEESDFFNYAYSIMKDSFNNEQEFFIYLNESLKKHLTEKGLL